MELFSQHSSMRRADHSGFPCRRGLLIEGNIVVVGASGSGLASVSKKPGASKRGAAQAADVTQPEQAAQLVEAAVAAFGGIDILVNNVGGGRGGPHIVDSIDEDWRAAFEVNLVQTVRMMRLALPHMSGRAGAAV